MSDDRRSPPFSLPLRKTTALALLTGLGTGLAGILLFDIYQDWIPEGKPLWSTLAENGIPFLLALSIPLIAWRLAHTEQGEFRLREATKWTILGSVVMLLIAGLALGFQLIQGEFKPLILVAQLAAAGAFSGLIVGYARARVRHTTNQDHDGTEEAPPLFSFQRMGNGVQGALLLMAAIGFALSGTILFDVYHDWIVQGNALWSTLLENLVPLALALLIPVAGWLAAQVRSKIYVTEAATWAFVGTVGTLIVASIVLGFQVYQGQIKPWVTITQLTTVGAVAGLLIGYHNAQTKETQDMLQTRESRLRGLANSVPGGVFQFEVWPDRTYKTTFVSDTAEQLLGISTDGSGAYIRFLRGVRPPYRQKAVAALQNAIDRAAPWNVEVPFEEPSGEQVWLQIRSTPDRHEDRLIFHGIVTDITEKKEAERRRKTYEELKESAQDAIVIADEAGEIVDWNPGAESIFGHTREDVLGRPVETIMPERHREPHRKGMERVLETGNAKYLGETVELEGLHREGHEVPIELSLFSWQGDREQYFAAIIRDITERKETQHALEQERDRFETLFESLPTPVVRCVVKDEGVIIADANQAFEETFGFKSKTAEGQDVNELLVPPQNREKAVQLDKRALERGHLQTEVQRQTADGLRDFQLQVARRDPENGPPEIYAIYADITEQKERERQLDAIFNHTFQFTGLMKPDGTMIEVNDTALRFGGLEREDIIGKPLWETYWAQTGEESKKKLREAVRRAADGEFVRYEREIRGADENRVIDFSIRPVTDEDGEVTLLIPEARDITERKAYENKLKTAKEEAEESSRLKTALLANMSHEIRTPLTPINGFAETLAEELSGPEAKLAQRIQKSGRRLKETLDSVLELSQLEAGTQDLDPEWTDLRKPVEAVLDLLDPWAEEKDIRLTSDLPSTPVVGLWDERALHRIVENLVENAIKFTPENGRVSVRVNQTDGAGILEVEDTGIGIGDMAVPEVFEAFRQESEGMDREFEGTGLGLTIVRRFTAALDGTIDLETEKGEGTCFTLQLPLQEERGNGQTLTQGS